MMTHFTNPYAMDAMQPSVPEGSEFVSGEGLGEGLGDGVALASRDAIVAALSTVFDPEIPVNIYDLGLIYDIVEAGGDKGENKGDGKGENKGDGKGENKGDWKIVMTLTAPACPVAGELPQQVADAAACLSGVGRVCVRLTWDPPWSPELMSEDARYALGM